MKSQSEIISELDIKSSSAAGTVKFSLIRLVFSSLFVFLREFLLKGGIMRGADGIKKSVNMATLSFVTEAKRYERAFKDTSGLKRELGDLL